MFVQFTMGVYLSDCGMYNESLSKCLCNVPWGLSECFCNVPRVSLSVCIRGHGSLSEYLCNVTWESV